MSVLNVHFLVKSNIRVKYEKTCYERLVLKKGGYNIEIYLDAMGMNDLRVY